MSYPSQAIRTGVSRLPHVNEAVQGTVEMPLLEADGRSIGMGYMGMVDRSGGVGKDGSIPSQYIQPDAGRQLPRRITMDVVVPYIREVMGGFNATIRTWEEAWRKKQGGDAATDLDYQIVRYNNWRRHFGAQGLDLPSDWTKAKVYVTLVPNGCLTDDPNDTDIARVFFAVTPSGAMKSQKLPAGSVVRFNCMAFGCQPQLVYQRFAFRRPEMMFTTLVDLSLDEMRERYEGAIPAAMQQ